MLESKPVRGKLRESEQMKLTPIIIIDVKK